MKRQRKAAATILLTLTLALRLGGMPASAAVPAKSEPTVHYYSEEYMLTDIPAVRALSGSPEARQIIIRRLVPDIIRDGETFDLIAAFIGFEGLSYAVQWQYHDGNGWHDLPDANELFLPVVASRETLRYDWRVLVSIL